MILQEREKRIADTKSLRDKLREKEDAYELANIEMQEIQRKFSTFEAEHNYNEEALREREKALNDREKEWRSLERILKDQVAELAHEKNILNSKAQDLHLQLEAAEDELRHFKNVELQLTNERKFNKELREQIATKTHELSTYKQAYDNNRSHMDEDISSLNDELNRALSLISRQEATI